MDKVSSELLAYIRNMNPVAKSLDIIPLDQSLHDLGILDSFEIIELVEFIEKNWAIRILDSELTKENFGSVNKMVEVIRAKTQVPAASGE